MKSAKYKYLQPWAAKREEILMQMNTQDILSKMSYFSLQDKSNLKRYWRNFVAFSLLVKIVKQVLSELNTSEEMISKMALFSK